MKRHILLMTNVENPVESDEEEQRLLQVQEEEHRALQRFENALSIIFF